MDAAKAIGRKFDELEGTRPTIRLNDGNWNEVVRAAASTVADVVLLRDRMPMMLTTAAAASGRPVGDSESVELRGVQYHRSTPILISASPGLISYYLDERNQFERYMRREKEWIPTRCPDALAKRVVDAASEMNFRPCAGIVRVPLFRDGEIVSKAGWDSVTELVIDPPTLPRIPKDPTRAEAERALVRLLRPFRGFIEKQTADRCSLAAAALTAALRPSLPTAPAIVLDGNGPGVGKGKIARALSMIASGTAPAVVTEGASPEETEKRIAAVVMSGVPAALLDNLQRNVASSTLESALTEEVATIRIFGKLENLHVSCRALWCLTANNATLRRDLQRRTLPVRIVVPSDAPEKVRFDFDLVEETKKDRGQLLAAAYTIAKAWWAVRQLPENAAHHHPLGSFELWAELVGGAVSWLTGQNPVALIVERKENDLFVAAERELIEALAAKYDGERWKAAQAAADIDVTLWTQVLPSAPRRDDSKPSAKQVGNWLRGRKDRVFEKWMLCSDPDRKGVLEWMLKRVC